MITNDNLAEVDALVSRFFKIEDITYGSAKQPFLMRYRGSMIVGGNPAEFDHLIEALIPFKLIPLLHKEGSEQVLLLIPEPEKKKRLNPRLNLIMFVLTLLSVLLTGGLNSTDGELPGGIWQTAILLIKNGWSFAVSLLAILATHEFGHYFAGKRNGVKVTLPYFIPLPLSLFGTMGAFINMRSVPKNRRALFDLAVTGPLSGMAMSIFVIMIGLALSDLSVLPSAATAQGALQMEGNSLLYLLLKFISFGKLLPEPQNIKGGALLIYWVRYFFTGQPFPWGALDVMLHPVAWAGWAGMLVTGINLIPAGQLDGGHIFYTLFGKSATERAFPIIVTLLVLMGFAWNGWWLWAGLIFIFGRHHAEPMDQVTELDNKRKILGFISLVIFFLVFVPVPLTFVGL